MARREALSLNEWVVLALLVVRPRHGYDVAAELRTGTEIGEVWRLSRPLVYRALDRLAALGLVEERAHETGRAAPPRTIYGPTRRGRDRLRRWLTTPVAHLREVRGELLIKLVVAHRLGVDARPLIAAQRRAFAAHFAALAEPAPTDDPVAVWRHHAATAVRGFLEALARTG